MAEWYRPDPESYDFLQTTEFEQDDDVVGLSVYGGS